MYGLTDEEIGELPVSVYNRKFEQAFNIMHLYVGDGKYALQTLKDIDTQARLEYEVVKSQLRNTQCQTH